MKINRGGANPFYCCLTRRPIQFCLPLLFLALILPSLPGEAGQQPQGSPTQTLADGTKVTSNQDGSVTSQYTDGTKSTQNTDGSTTIEEQNGTKTTYKPDGTITKDYPPALKKKPELDSPLGAKNRKDGGKEYTYMDGRTVKFKGNGDLEVEERGPGGKKSTEYKKDGSRIVTLPGGVGFRADTTGQMPGGTLMIGVNASASLGDPARVLFDTGPRGDTTDFVSGDDVRHWDSPTDATGPIVGELKWPNGILINALPLNINLGSGWSQSSVPYYFVQDFGGPEAPADQTEQAAAGRSIGPCIPQSYTIQDLQQGKYTLVTDGSKSVDNAFVPTTALPVDDLYTKRKNKVENDGGYMLDASRGYNCHGFTFDRGGSEVEESFVPTILKDNYNEVMVATEAKAEIGDVIVYSQGGVIDHTGVVVEVDASGKPAMIASKWGPMGALFVHKPETYAEGYQIYRRKTGGLAKAETDKITELRDAYEKAKKAGADKKTLYQKAIDLGKELNALSRVAKT